MISPSEKHLLPQSTGVYLLWGNKELLYIGKSKNIRQRVENHLQNKSWAGDISGIDWIVLPSEEEALLTERELIQSRKPRYNIRLRDDRSYPMIAISLEEEYPRVFLSREKRRPDRMYFGPWTDARRAKQLLRTLPQIFPFRSCTGAKPGRGEGACLDYYIGRCGAPCIGKVSPEEYRQGIDRVIEFLSGKRSHIEEAERESMLRAAQQKDFETAALHRDRLRAIEGLSHRGRDWGDDRNVIGVATDQGEAAVSVLEIREGRISERRTFLLRNEENLPAEEVRNKFLDLFPQDYPSSEDAELLEIATRDARMQLRRDQSRRSETSLHPEEALLALEEIAGRKPLRIEGYDVANLGASATVGAMVVFQNGLPARKLYRNQSLSRDEPDDYQSMRDMVRWRAQAFLKHSRMSPFDPHRNSNLAELPDIVLVDGGAGQLSAALEEGGPLLEGGAVFLALSKREETIWKQEGATDIPKHNPGSQLLQRVRDEAHRVSNQKHQSLRSKESFASALDRIPGLGAKKQAALLGAFGSLEKVRSASPEEIARVPGIGNKLARKIHHELSSC